MGSGSAGSGAAPPAREARALEGVVGVDGRGPGGAGAAQAEAGEAQALPTALRAGQQRHLLGGHLRRRDHGRLGVALQLPQVCGERAGDRRVQAGGASQNRPLAPAHRPLCPSATTSRGAHPGALGLTLEQGVQQVLAEAAGAAVMDKEAWMKANP